MWLILGTAAYIKETGDVSILDEQVPFDSNPDNTATLFEHLKRSYYHVIHNLGPHGLPLIGRADWNDCLNLNCFSKEPGESFQTTENIAGGTAESVFIAGLFVYVSPDFAEICRMRGLEDEAAEAVSQAEKMSAITLEHGFDGDWFLRAYDHYGEKSAARKTKKVKSSSSRKVCASWPVSA